MFEVLYFFQILTDFVIAGYGRFSDLIESVREFLYIITILIRYIFINVSQIRCIVLLDKIIAFDLAIQRTSCGYA